MTVMSSPFMICRKHNFLREKNLNKKTTKLILISDGNFPLRFVTLIYFCKVLFTFFAPWKKNSSQDMSSNKNLEKKDVLGDLCESRKRSENTFLRILWCEKVNSDRDTQNGKWNSLLVTLPWYHRERVHAVNLI